MHRRSLALIAILVVALLAGAGGVYAYDQGKDGEIAEGIKVNGVDVGGLSASQARTKLRAALLDPLNRPVRARFEGKTYKLTPQQAEIAVDIDGSVRRALIRSREGDILSRTWREVRGRPILTDLDAKVSYSKASIRRLVARVQRDLAIEPVSASVDLEGGSVAPQALQGRPRRAGRPPAPRPRAQAAGLRRPPARAGPHERRRARGLHRGPREEVSGGPDRQPRLVLS